MKWSKLDRNYYFTVAVMYITVSFIVCFILTLFVWLAMNFRRIVRREGDGRGVTVAGADLYSATRRLMTPTIQQAGGSHDLVGRKKSRHPPKTQTKTNPSEPEEAPSAPPASVPEATAEDSAAPIESTPAAAANDTDLPIRDPAIDVDPKQHVTVDIRSNEVVP